MQLDKEGKDNLILQISDSLLKKNGRNPRSVKRSETYDEIIREKDASNKPSGASTLRHNLQECSTARCIGRRL